MIKTGFIKYFLIVLTLNQAHAFVRSQSIDHWQPGCRFCELYLNGSYQGVYTLWKILINHQVIMSWNGTDLIRIMAGLLMAYTFSALPQGVRKE